MTPEEARKKVAEIEAEAWAAYGRWLAEQPEEIKEMDPLEQAQLYASWCDRK